MDTEFAAMVIVILLYTLGLAAIISLGWVKYMFWAAVFGCTAYILAVIFLSEFGREEDGDEGVKE